MGRPRGAKNRQHLLPDGTFGSRKLAVALGMPESVEGDFAMRYANPTTCLLYTSDAADE